MRQLLFLLLVLSYTAMGFFPGNVKLGTKLRSVTQNRHDTVKLHQQNADRNVLGSKLMPPYNEAEMAEMLKELNITNFDVALDPEITKWAPSKQFFEQYGFQNNTERYKRKTMHVKIDFYSNYTNPILPQYKTFISDLLTVVFLQTIDSRFKYDALFAFGICTQYYTIMKGYALQEEIDVMFNELMKAVGFSPAKLREDAKRMLELIKATASVPEAEFLRGGDNELGKLFASIQKDRFFKYTDAWGVGLGRLMELREVDPGKEVFERWSAALRWVPPTRLLQSWDEFCADQIRMQGVEVMQKQIMIREKKRAAARLESKAVAFDDKKKALQELNEMIEERRAQLIQEARDLKRKYEPDAYEEIVRQEQKGSSSGSVPGIGAGVNDT